MFWFQRRRKQPTQEFTGYVRAVEHDRCWLMMNDVTDPTMPQEEWGVNVAMIPPNAKVGQYVRLRMWTEWEIL